MSQTRLILDEREKIDSCLALKENLEAVFNSVYDGIISMDNELTVVNLNEAAQSFFGVRKKDVVGRKCFCEEMFSEIKDILLKSVRKKKPIRNFSFKFEDRAGDERTVILSTSILRDRDGADRGAILIIHDISDTQKLRKMLDGGPAYHKLVGRTAGMREVYSLIEKVSRSDAPVLIEGESGSGKGLVAEAIHNGSNRRDGPFVKVNCAALSESLLDSELFGHVKGAFTGALRDRVGRFELAQGGTIFLDEIGDIPPLTQIKLLNVLQDKVIERLGDTQPRKVDVRIISATNRKLKDLVTQRIFREDLYYRLKVVRIELPPLRERAADIRLLVDNFIERGRKETGRAITGVSSEALKLLTRYRWPGNVRELENAIAHAFALREEGLIQPEDLPEEIARGFSATREAREGLDDIADEKARIIAALDRAGWRKNQAARLLGVHRATLWRKMKEHNIS
ncbi:MAG: sigma-54 interaction domain-containing protein [Candidatus Nitrospinota bacterium M3_3B_026]